MLYIKIWLPPPRHWRKSWRAWQLLPKHPHRPGLFFKNKTTAFYGQCLVPGCWDPQHWNRWGPASKLWEGERCCSDVLVHDNELYSPFEFECLSHIEGPLYPLRLQMGRCFQDLAAATQPACEHDLEMRRVGTHSFGWLMLPWCQWI